MGDPEPQPRRRLPWLGRLALALAIAGAVATGVGIALATAGLFEAGTVVAWVSAATGGLAVAVGLAAVITRRGTGAGVAGMVLGFIANPLVLTAGLSALR